MKNSHTDATLFGRWIKPLLIGLAVGVIGCVALLMLMAALIQTVDVPRVAVLPLAIAAAAVGAFLAGLTAAIISKNRGLIMGLISGAVLFLLILSAGFIRYADVDGTVALIKLAVLTLAGGVGGFLGVSRR